MEGSSQVRPSAWHSCRPIIVAVDDDDAACQLSVSCPSKRCQVGVNGRLECDRLDSKLELLLLLLMVPSALWLVVHAATHVFACCPSGITRQLRVIAHAQQLSERNCIIFLLSYFSFLLLLLFLPCI